MTSDAAQGGRRLNGRSRLVVWGAAATLMVLPVLAMRFTNEVDWDPGDFMFLGILLVGVGLTYELAARLSDRRAYQAAVGIAFAAAFLSIWINLAVGIIGTEDNPANLIYGGVLAVAAAGAIIARLRPRGMARAMIAAAFAQMLTFVVALTAGLGFTGPITVFFTALCHISLAVSEGGARSGFRHASALESVALTARVN